jgi:hypothetical protein
MIYQDFYETRPNLKREPQDRETVRRRREVGHNIADTISTRTLWLSTDPGLAGNINLPTDLINWNIGVSNEPPLQKKRLIRAFNRLQLVVDPEYPLVTVYQFGSLNKEIEELMPIAAFKEFKWLYPHVQSVRTMTDPDQLFHQIGGYEAELVLGILGWH